MTLSDGDENKDNNSDGSAALRTVVVVVIPISLSPSVCLADARFDWDGVNIRTRNEKWCWGVSSLRKMSLIHVDLY